MNSISTAHTTTLKGTEDSKQKPKAPVQDDSVYLGPLNRTEVHMGSVTHNIYWRTPDEFKAIMNEIKDVI